MAIWTARDILDSIDEGKLRLAIAKDENEAAAQQRADLHRAEIEAAWAPIVAKIKESTPEWAWEYITYPVRMPTYRSEHVTIIAPACIDLESMGQVFAYHRAMPNEFPLFLPAEWGIQDDDEAWSVCPSNGGSETVYSLPGHPDFLIALAQAYDNALRIPELMAVADRRNAERAANVPYSETPEPPTRAEHDWVGLARLAVGENARDQAAIAYALIGILEQLQKVTTPLYNGSQHAIQTFDNSRGQL
jgi:hypothetical protein